jgi:hypothetical protein
MMLVHNRPLTATYQRVGAILRIVYCILCSFAQWLEAGAGFSRTEAGLITLAMSRLCGGSVTRGRPHQKHTHPFHHQRRRRAVAVMFFGLPRGMRRSQQCAVATLPI